MPGFAVLFPAGAFAGDVGIEAEAGGLLDGCDGQDVTDIYGQDVGDQEVDVVGGVGDFALAVDAVNGLDVVAAGAEDFGEFELYAPQAGAVADDEVVAFAVSPGLGDVKAQGFGLEPEGGFGDFSGAFRVVVEGMGH